MMRQQYHTQPVPPIGPTPPYHPHSYNSTNSTSHTNPSDYNNRNISPKPNSSNYNIPFYKPQPPSQSSHFPTVPPIPAQSQFNHTYHNTPPLKGLNPTTNNVLPLPAIPSIISQNRDRKNRKRTATEMMDENPQQSQYTQTNATKRLKLERSRRSSSPLKPKHSKTRTNNHKMEMSVQTLKLFADEHSGKLPSLRYIMKMLKVGFPKAHEIIDEYSKAIGRSKDAVVQDMTVRQENERKSNKRGRRSQKSAETKVKIEPKSPHITSVSDTNTFSMKLTRLLETVATDTKWDIFEQKYWRNMSKLQLFMDKVCSKELISVCDLEDRVNIGTAYYMLSESYYSRGIKRNIGIRYMEMGLSVFKQCNAMAVKCGLYSDRDENGMCITNINHSHALREYMGYFWKEIVCILLLGGDILLDKKDLNGAQHKYELSYNLVESVTGTSDGVSKREYLYKCLEKLSMIHCYKRDYNGCIQYATQYLSNISSNNSGNRTPSVIEVKNVIEVKAWLACNLMFCVNKTDKENGYKYYESVMTDSIAQIGKNDTFTNGWLVYFAVHFIRTREWNEAHILMRKILEIEDKYCTIELKEDIHSVFMDYIECVQYSEYVAQYREVCNGIMNALHWKHVSYVKDINVRAMIKQNEFKSKNNPSVSVANHSQNSNSHSEADFDDEDIDLVLNDAFGYNVDSEYNYLYPKINIVSVIVTHLNLLKYIGNQTFVSQILSDLVVRDAKCLKKTSKYWENYPIHKITQNEIISLLNM